MKVLMYWTKGIPYNKISQFEDDTVYNVAVYTRDFTKNLDAFPYLTGELRRREVAASIWGNNKEYGLRKGIDYANAVWKMTDVNWTNKKTRPQWYYNVFLNHKYTIVNQAKYSALKEI